MSDVYIFKSICRIIMRPDGRKPLRLADIANDGRITKFISSIEAPRKFANRDLLFHRNDDIELDEYRVFEWEVEPNKDDETKDYVTTQLQKKIKPVQIIILNLLSLRTVLSMLRENIAFYEEIKFEKILIVIRKTVGVYEGIYIEKNDLEKVSEGMYRLKKSIISVPIYKIHDNDMLYLDHDVCIYNNIVLKSATDKILTKQTVEIVRDELINHYSWNVVKQRNDGTTRDAWKQLRELLNSYCTNDFYQQVAEMCNYSVEEAKEDAKKIINNFEEYIEARDVGSQMLYSLVCRNDNLKKECMTMLQDEWSNNNVVNIDKVAGQVRELEEEKKRYEKEIYQLKSEYNDLKNIFDDLHAQTIQANKEIAATKEKLMTKAKETSVRMNSNEISSINSMNDILASLKNSLYQENNNAPVTFYSKNLAFEYKECNSWSTQLKLLGKNLKQVGVKSEYRSEMARILFSAYVHNLALLIAGPYGEDIARICSLVFNNVDVGILECKGEFNEATIQEMLASQHQVIVIKNAFLAQWENRILELLQERNKFYIIINPIMEDIYIEPNSIFNYMTPIITDLLLDDFSTNKYIGCKQADNFKYYDTQEQSNDYIQEDNVEEIFKESNISNIALKRIMTIIHESYKLGGNSLTEQYILCFAPYYLLTENVEGLIMVVRNSSLLDESDKEEILEAIGVGK